MSLTTQSPDQASAGRAAPGIIGADGLQAGSGAERLLMDAAERALRAPKGKLAMALHLSRLKNPSPRPYHARIALALMLDTAQRLGGQVFPMRNTDLVLLCAAPEAERRPGRPSPAPLSLTASLEHLFGFDAPGAVLTSIWRLDDQPGAFRDYIAQRQAEATPPEPQHEDGVTAAGLSGLMTRLAGIDLRQILMQQTAIVLRPGAGLPLSSRIRPLYREMLLPPVPLPGSPQAASDAASLADPFIYRHVAGVLATRVLTLVADDLQAGGTLTRPCLLLGIPMHLNLSPEAIVSPAFARLAHRAHALGARFAVEMSAMDVAADPVLTAFARQSLAQTGFDLVLDGINHAGLAMIDTSALGPQTVKLAWSSRLADGPRSLLEPIEAAIGAVGPGHIVLHEADGEAALAWGQSRGIMRYQGPFIDSVQAAARIATCHSARACTLRQCTVRAQALSPLTRAGCGNPGLLDLTGIQAPPT